MLRAPETQPEHASLAAAVLGGRIIELCDELAQFSEEPGRLTCTYLTPAHRAAASQLASWMQAAGLDTSIDTVGNVIGRYRSADPNAKTLIVGSHYDTVRDAGKYDGRLGIVTALVVAEEIVAPAIQTAVSPGADRVRGRGGRALRHRLSRQPRDCRQVRAANPGAPRCIGRDRRRRDRVGRRQSRRHSDARAPARRFAGLPRDSYRARAGVARGRSAARDRHRDRRRRTLRGCDHRRRRARRDGADGLAARCRGRCRRAHLVPGDIVPGDSGIARDRRADQCPWRRRQRRSGPLRPVARHPLRG